MAADPETEEVPRCDFCRLPMPEDPVTMEYEGDTYEFCSGSCRDAMNESDRVFTEYRGYHRFRPGVSALDAALPQGMLRNSLVLLSGQAGSRRESLHAELVWRALRRGEPAVYVTFQEPPIAVVEDFLAMDWNVIPYLEGGQFHVLDAFTYRMDDRDRMHDRMNDWNRYLHDVLVPTTTRIRDAGDTAEIANKLDSCLEALQMVDTGIVLVDSLTELGTLVQPVQAYDFVKDLRADVCKGRFVPVFAGATLSGNGSAFPHDLAYTVDGVVDLELNGDIVEDTLMKRARIRKMNGVLSYTEWTAYEYTAGLGMVTFDPREEITKSRGDGSRSGDSAAGGGPDSRRQGAPRDDPADPTVGGGSARPAESGADSRSGRGESGAGGQGDDENDRDQRNDEDDHDGSEEADGGVDR